MKVEWRSTAKADMSALQEIDNFRYDLKAVKNALVRFVEMVGGGERRMNDDSGGKNSHETPEGESGEVKGMADKALRADRFSFYF